MVPCQRDRGPLVPDPSPDDGPRVAHIGAIDVIMQHVHRYNSRPTEGCVDCGLFEFFFEAFEDGFECHRRVSQ